MRMSQWFTLRICSVNVRPRNTIDTPKVRGEVNTEDSAEAKAVDGKAESESPKDDTDVRDENLAIVVGREDDRRRLEVCVELITWNFDGDVSTYGSFQPGTASDQTRW